MRLIVDSDLAELYGVRTKALLQAVRRNPDRFPPDFLIQLDNQDVAVLRSQIVTSKRAGRGGRRYVVNAFTEHGAVMAATILNSARAIAVSIFVVRAFVQMRESLTQHRELGKRLDELEVRLEERLGKQDRAIADILEAIHQLLSPPAPPAKPGIGFVR
jgi:phage regulator Rha-like protein